MKLFPLYLFHYLSKKYFPNIRLHASTQLTIHNSYGAIQAKQMGFERAVLARELSFDEIKSIKNKSNIELEIFCHGALCFCVSGLCLFSSFIGGYSGNRGHCAQPCRRLWSVDGKKGYFLSPKDFQLIDYIKQIKEIGITSLKIEGRLKSADYVNKTDPHMPFHGPHLVEVHLAEGDKQDTEHEQRHYLVEDGRKEACGIIERRHESKDKIHRCAHHHGHRQCPVFQQTNNLVFALQFTCFSHNHIRKQRLLNLPSIPTYSLAAGKEPL